MGPWVDVKFRSRLTALTFAGATAFAAGAFLVGCDVGEPAVERAEFTAELERSIFTSSSDEADLDLNSDGLVDDLEGALGYAFRPYFVFDSDEAARASAEPITLFQVRRNPIGEIRSDGTRISRVDVKWVFLFRRDGGYGPDSDCSDDHEGDNDDALFTLETRDSGVSWRLTRAALSSRGSNNFAGPDWPSDGDLELFDLTHPKIFLSAHKHHEYLDTSYDHRDSRYSDVFLLDDCNDDVNGAGDQFLANVHSIAIRAGDFTTFARDFNNVGEAGAHPSPRFVNDLSGFFAGHSAWGLGGFYEVGPISEKWLR